MSMDLTISTSPRRLPVSMFRMADEMPFQPGLFGWQAQAPRRTAPHISNSFMDEEVAPLVKRARHVSKDRDNLIIVSGVSLWCLLIVVIFIMWWQFSSSVSYAQTAARPYMMTAMNHTLSILRNVDKSTVTAQGVMDGAQSISSKAVPAMERALNQTAAMIDRLEKLARNPVLQLSLQQGVVPGVG